MRRALELSGTDSERFQRLLAQYSGRAGEPVDIEEWFAGRVWADELVVAANLAGVDVGALFASEQRLDLEGQVEELRRRIEQLEKEDQ